MSGNSAGTVRKVDSAGCGITEYYNVRNLTGLRQDTFFIILLNTSVARSGFSEERPLSSSCGWMRHTGIPIKMIFQTDQRIIEWKLAAGQEKEEKHMARIAGVDLPRDKRVEIGLTYIYGIGRASSNRILAQAGVNPDTRVRDLTDEEVKKIAGVIDETQTVEGDLRRQVAMDIKRLQEIGCYRGIRHRKGLPVRGQKTKTNARTRKGPRRTVANKKK